MIQVGDNITNENGILTVKSGEYSFSGNFEKMNLNVNNKDCVIDVIPRGYILQNGGSVSDLRTVKFNILKNITKDILFQ